MEILTVENLSFSYPGKSGRVLNNINMSINQGDFVVITGDSGSGKSTLLRLLKRELAPHGKKEGSISFKGDGVESMSDFDSASKIGFVMQNPDNQIVTDKVWSELAFGLENLGLPPQVIRSRVGEMANYFGIHSWFRKNTTDLSGGQKQLLNLASIIVMQPDVLILDEPTAQLDPIAASDFIKTVYQLNQEMGITVIMVEHRLEEVFSLASSVVWLDEGKLGFKGTPDQFASQRNFYKKGSKVALSLPVSVRLFHSLNGVGKIPLNNREGIHFIEDYFSKTPELLIEEPKKYDRNTSEIIARMKNVWFRYSKKSEDILSAVDLTIYKQDVFCLLGGNGSGKSTLMKVLAGLEQPYEGSVKLFGQKNSFMKKQGSYRNKIAVLPQNPLSLFTEETVGQDYASQYEMMGFSKTDYCSKLSEVSDLLKISHLIEYSPYDLSGGEQQLVGLGKLLLMNPEFLLLDEPTKGLDAAAKNNLGILFKELKKKGVTIFIVTHDVDFAAQFATQCALYFDHQVISLNDPTSFFSTNYFYTTATNKMVRKYLPKAIRLEDVLSAVGIEGGSNERL